jgi:hypothetical protein
MKNLVTRRLEFENCKYSILTRLSPPLTPVMSAVDSSLKIGAFDATKMSIVGE